MHHEEKRNLEDINIEMKRGEKIAIVGCNGTGKSTFIKSIIGFTEYAGDILNGNVDLKDPPNKSIFSLIPYIPQDDFTSDDTILNNLK